MSNIHHLNPTPAPVENSLFDLAPCGLVICDRQRLVIRANTFFQQMSGQSEAMFTESRPFLHHLTRPSRFIFSAKILPQLTLTGEAREMIQQNTKQLHHVEASAVCEHDSNGAVIGMFGVFHDIADIVRAQEDVAESESRYRLLADNASDLITVFDMRGRIEYISPSVEVMLGYPPEAFIGRSVRDFVLPEDYEEAAEAYRAYLTSANWNESPHIRYRIRHAEGHLVWFEAHPKVICDPDSQIVRYHDVVRDITQQKAIEDALAQASIEANAAAEAKAQFLATMSHELRTPLTSIIGYSSLLRDLLTDNDGLRRHSQRIHSAGQGLLALINDILDHSKLEAGQLELDIEPCSVSDLTRDVLDLLTLQVDAKGLGLRLTGAESVPDDLMVDEQRLRQILMNLIGNAVKFTDTGGVAINIGWRETPENRLRISVTDTGLGISPEDQAQLFQRFSQINKATGNQNGTGLGLLICKQLVTLMGGDVGVESRLGHGSIFWFDIPAAVNQDDNISKECEQ